MKTFSFIFSLIAAISFSACGPATVAKATIETQAMAALTAKVGQQAPQITCAQDMTAEVGRTQVCSIVLDGKTYDVTVTITGVSGSKVTLDVLVATAPRAG